MLNWDYLRGMLWFVASLFLCQCNDAATKYVGFFCSPMQTTFLRFFFATLLLVPILATGGRRAFFSKNFPIHICRGGLLCAAVATWCHGLNHSPLPQVVVVGFAMPFFVLILSRIFLKERASLLRWLATILGFVGVAVVADPWCGEFNWPVLALLAADLCFAALDILNKKLAAEEPMGTLLFHTALATTLLAAGPAIAGWQSFPSQLWAHAIWLGLGANLLLFCLIRALRLVEASATAPYRYLEFVFSIGLGYLFFGDVAGKSTLLGAAIIIPTTLFLSCHEGRRLAASKRSQLSPKPAEPCP
ncbi:MAG: DMT family transporter [Puniceicoccales bacterium]|nr:DMT family transporter [Puniceicoccales bacterium]